MQVREATLSSLNSVPPVCFLDSRKITSIILRFMGLYSSNSAVLKVGLWDGTKLLKGGTGVGMALMVVL